MRGAVGGMAWGATPGEGELLVAEFRITNLGLTRATSLAILRGAGETEGEVRTKEPGANVGFVSM